MPAISADNCPFCDYVGRSDHVNRHIMARHQTPDTVIGNYADHSVSIHPVKRNIVIVKNKAGKELLAYCFDCFTRCRTIQGQTPYAAANKHSCRKKKAAVDDAPTLSIAEVPVAGIPDSLPALPPPPPAAPRGIDWEAAVRSLLPEKRATALKRCYDEEMDWITENMEGDVSHLDWRGMIIDAIADRTELVAFQKECQEKLTAAQERVVFAEQRAAAAEAMTCHHQKQSLADKLAVEQMCDALHASETHNRELQKRLGTKLDG
jgi:hypothetical protein